MKVDFDRPFNHIFDQIAKNIKLQQVFFFFKMAISSNSLVWRAILRYKHNQEAPDICDKEKLLGLEPKPCKVLLQWVLVWLLLQTAVWGLVLAFAFPICEGDSFVVSCSLVLCPLCGNDLAQSNFFLNNFKWTTHSPF